MSDEIDEYLDDVLTAHRAVMFLNGGVKTPSDPSSALGLDLLYALKIEFHAEDVSRNPALLARVQARSDWQNIPQFFIDGQFICDSYVMMDAIKSKQFDTILTSRKIEFDAEMADKIRDANS